MATCKDCIHYTACVFRVTDHENENCIGFLNKADVVEVVRCKDCKYSEETEPVFGIVDYTCKRLLTNCLSAEDFCSYGERRYER